MIIGITGNDILAGTGRHGWRGGDRCSECLHDAAAIGLLIIADLYLINGSFQPEYLCGKEEGVTNVTTETGAGQWGAALSYAAKVFGLEAAVYQVKISYNPVSYTHLKSSQPLLADHAEWFRLYFITCKKAVTSAICGF